ncbi:MAG: glycoside hydrolase family 10 protein [Cyanophyceae cyanobacterium]
MFQLRLNHYRKTLRLRRAIALLLVSLLTIGVIATTAERSNATASEIRGVWLTNVDSDVLFSSSATQAAIKRLADLNFNTIYPTVWQGGYTLYPSRVAQAELGVPVYPTPGLQNRDVLQEAITEGHQLGLAVIPWFEFGFMMPAESEFVQQHPDWLTTRHDGTTVKLEGIHERVWLNPFHPEVQQFILDLITEIVTNYDIDGIQFDDHFGLPAEFGYDEFTVAQYQAELNSLPATDYQETFWVRWRADRLNEFMERVFTTVKAIRPNCIISLSPNPYHFALPAYLQDWFTWERQGWIEEIVLQVYRADMGRFITELERTEVELAKEHIPVAIGIMSGLKNRSTPVSTIQQQVKAVRQRGFAGVSFFFYESLWKWSEDPPELRERVLEQLFSTAVPRSYGPNLSSPSRSIPSDR